MDKILLKISFEFYQFFHRYSFSVTRSYPGSHITFTCFSLFLCSLYYFLRQLLIVLHDLDIFKEYYFSECLSILVSLIFFMVGLRLCILGSRIYTRNDLCPQYIILQCFVVWLMLNLVTWLKWLVHCKVTIFPFVVKKYLGALPWWHSG